ASLNRQIPNDHAAGAVDGHQTVKLNPLLDGAALNHGARKADEGDPVGPDRDLLVAYAAYADRVPGISLLNCSRDGVIRAAIDVHCFRCGESKSSTAESYECDLVSGGNKLKHVDSSTARVPLDRESQKVCNRYSPQRRLQKTMA